MFSPRVLSSTRAGKFLRHAALLVCLFTVAGLAGAQAQDRLVFRDNHTQDGKVTGMSGTQVMITLTTANGAAGQMGFDLGLLSRVEVAPPPEYQAGMAAYQAGSWDKALAVLKPLAAKFRGLPTEWMRQTAAVLGDLYVEKKDIASAEASYNDFKRLYPGGTGNALRSTVGQARVAFAKNNAAAVKQQLAPVTEAALKSPATVTKSDGVAYGQAFYLMGQLEERDGAFQAALEDYLRATTLFYQDASVAANAQKSADALRAAHKGLTVP